MNTQWHERFTAAATQVADAQVDEAGNIGFDSNIEPNTLAIGPKLADSRPILVELSRLAVVDITGEHAAEFFQAQVCNDLDAMGLDQAQINGYCSLKGRLMALFTVFALPAADGAIVIEGDAAKVSGYRLLLPTDVEPTFTKRLQMFAGLPLKIDGKAVKADVTLTHRSDLVCAGFAFDADAEKKGAELPESYPTLPESPLGLSSNDNVQIIRWHDDTGTVANPDTHTRYICISSHDALFELWQNESYSHAALPYWRWGDINAGIPNVFAASSDQFIPQMLNMQLINGLSFKKGCYPGQEIVARMQYLGKLKKHMKHLHVPGVTVAPEPGTTLTTESNNNAGQIVDAVVDEHGLNLLAVVNIETPVAELLLDGVTLQEAPIPYSLGKPDGSADS